ncbi:MAG: hypothetical protein L6Q54_11600 [Leptospiraceae bacterium]|nr:hypothetical protein [Leptospiraceae bacterium]
MEEIIEAKESKHTNKQKVFAYHINVKNGLPVEGDIIDLEYQKYSKGESGKFSRLTFDNKKYGFGTNMRLNIDGKRIEVKTFSNNNGTVEIGFVE